MSKVGGIYGYKVLQGGVSAVGNGAEVELMGVNDGAYSEAVCQVLISGTATVKFQGSIDGVNWVDVLGQNIGTGEIGTDASASGIYRVLVQGLVKFRARVNSRSSGTITVVGSLVGGGGGGYIVMPAVSE